VAALDPATGKPPGARESGRELIAPATRYRPGVFIVSAGFEPVKAGGLEQSGRLEVGGDLHDLIVGRAQARSLIGRA
jgi:hypothetical protein